MMSQRSGQYSQNMRPTNTGDHHPDWRNAWNKVEIVLTTDDAGGLSARNLALAKEIDKLV